MEILDKGELLLDGYVTNEDELQNYEPECQTALKEPCLRSTCFSSGMYESKTLASLDLIHAKSSPENH